MVFTFSFAKQEESPAIPQLPAAFFQPNFSDENAKIETLTFDDLKFNNGAVVLKRVSDIHRLQAETDLAGLLKTSDLKPGVYEGGFKIWECAVDLVEWMDKKKVDFEGKRVLDLGCGAGIPGIYALLKGAMVDFQDYNEEVLSRLTVPTMLKNLKEHNTLQQVGNARFISGDWNFFDKLVMQNAFEGYDYILSTDTIYSISSLPALMKAVKGTMKPSGSAFFGAKRYYFGLGGNTALLAKKAKEQNMTCQVAEEYTDGQSNVRETILVTHS